MRRTTALLIISLLLLNVWFGVQAPRVAGEVVRKGSVTLKVGETAGYEYFNITLVDINPVSGTVLLNVTGIQGSELATVEDTYVDIFGDGSIRIKTTYVSSSTREAMLSIEVDVEALAGVACSILSEEIEQVNETGILPANVTKQFVDNLNLAEQYRRSGWYDDSIRLAWKTLDELRATIEIATKAKRAILDAKSALNDPSSVSPGCEGCPLSIQVKVKDKINRAEQYYQQGDFESALAYAQDALQLIKDCCESCKVFPSKKREVLDYIKTYGTGIPTDLFKEVYNKIDKAQSYYDNGDCVDAIDYLDDAKSLADFIITNWNRATLCRSSLLSNITQAERSYFITYNNTIIRIYLDDIEKKAKDDLYEKIKSGYFTSAMSECHNLAESLEARIREFNETKSVMLSAQKNLTDVQARGYKIDDAWDLFNEGLELIKSGSYEDAQSRFMGAVEKAYSIVKLAEDALETKNKTLSCFNDLRAEGIDAQKLFGDEFNHAQNLYDEGKYEEAKNLWEVLYQKCNDPDIKEAIRLRKKAHETYSSIEASKIPIPRSVKDMLAEADTNFGNFKFSTAKVQYDEVIKKLEWVNETAHRVNQTVQKGREFLKQNSKWGMNVARWLGIPIVKERLETLDEMINITLNDYRSANYEKAEQDLEEINSLMKDIDGDNVKNWNDPVPYVPNYYLVGLIVALALIFLNVLR